MKGTGRVRGAGDRNARPSPRARPMTALVAYPRPSPMPGWSMPSRGSRCRHGQTAVQRLRVLVRRRSCCHRTPLPGLRPRRAVGDWHGRRGPVLAVPLPCGNSATRDNRNGYSPRHASPTGGNNHARSPRRLTNASGHCARIGCASMTGHGHRPGALAPLSRLGLHSPCLSRDGV
jgi:hypothetical protein